MKKHLIISSIVSLGIMTACNNTSERNTDAVDLDKKDSASAATMEPENDAPESYERDGLKIYPAPQSIAYENSSLEMKSPTSDASIQGTKVSFDFDVKDYELGIQTADATDKRLANSDKGQHIHLIIDNGPYSAHYEPDFSMDVEAGHHVAIAFLSRSYHESVKNPNSYKVFQFTTGDNGKGDMKKSDLNQPMLFYSRPKGEYKGQDAQKVLLDFFLVNAELKPNGYSVKATINGKAFEFDTWQPYIVEGMPMGENTIKLELVDAKGSLVAGDMTSVSRTFTLTE
ncbi:MAG TPA: phosphopeptide-binding protein [Cryomorphaceae bacterium]|nr:phosphopeptide-binding protein [Owenweeksia sp.]MBG00410.1 phosphopeptide-binding protein [Owenweeksia sp.]HAD98407.1 phosphopeptide-binding protein [Cryomorphaceae bacterium]HBF20639.1 phosphopeptide-binding protein [Cryomorphaceae bacterium]HCQ16518.1 phosphopeptide-binding protein [Cryomorphaceae bacterium]|tara:strand:+ start:260 stop:1114 length:855 start_codon:yes stop_codon:yes gene_type:complete